MNTDHATQATLPPFSEVIEIPQHFMRNKEWSRAQILWSVLRAAYPQQAAPWLQGATTELSLGELKQARNLLSHALEQFPNNPAAYTISAELSIKNKQWDEAEKLLQLAREKSPDNLYVWLKSAECAEYQGDLNQAIAFNEKARQCAPDTPAAFIQHAELAMHDSQWERALQHWETLRHKFPEIPAGYLRAAEAARQLGRPQEARQLMLSQEYGSDIFESEATAQASAKQNKKRSNFLLFLELIWAKTLFNLHSEVHRNYLSYGWWVLEPLLHMIVYYVVFGLLLQRGGENFTVFLLSGLIPWMWFMKAVSVSSSSIISAQNLILQVNLAPITFPLISILQATLKQLPVFILLFCFVWLQGFSPDSHWWYLIPVIIVEALLICAIACAVAAIIPFVRDVSYLVPTGLSFMMFLSGIFYDYRRISEEWQDLFLLNPMAFMLKCYREILMEGIVPDLVNLGWWGAGSAIACMLLIFAFKKLRYTYPRIVLE